MNGLFNTRVNVKLWIQSHVDAEKEKAETEKIHNQKYVVKKKSKILFEKVYNECLNARAFVNESTTYVSRE